MAEAALVDTDVLINASRGSQVAVGFLEVLEQSGHLVISIVTQMELIVGCRNKDELRIINNFLRRFRIIPINELTSQRAVELLSEYRLAHGLLIADALIAATALGMNYSLASGNHRHFRFIPELDLLPYIPPQG